MKLAHVAHEPLLGLADVEHRLPRLGVAEEDDEVDGMAVAQGDADLRIVLEAADARAVARARVDDHVRAALRVDGDALRRHDAHQRVVDGRSSRRPHHLVGEMQQRRLPRARRSTKCFRARGSCPRTGRPLRGIDRVLVPVGPPSPGRRRLLRRAGNLLRERFLHAFAVAGLRELRSVLEDLGDFRGESVGAFELFTYVSHRNLRKKRCLSRR